MTNKVTIVKIGGNIIDDAGKLNKFLKDFAQLKESKILVHGGGKIATEISKSLGIEAQLIDGRRITDQETLKVVTMVYGGLVNKNIVAKLQVFGCNAIGLTGADANLIPARKRPVTTIDFGFVGDITDGAVNSEIVSKFLQSELIPVFAPLTHDGQGNLLNTNADTIASVLAVALAKKYETQLIYCFEKKGVLAEISDEKSVISQINKAQYETLKADGTIALGMIPKLDNAFEALQKGVRSVVICHADAIGQLDQENSTAGTTLVL